MGMRSGQMSCPQELWKLVGFELSFWEVNPKGVLKFPLTCLLVRLLLQTTMYLQDIVLALSFIILQYIYHLQTPLHSGEPAFCLRPHISAMPEENAMNNPARGFQEYNPHMNGKHALNSSPIDQIINIPEARPCLRSGEFL
jgi:hypothetical protein